MVWSVDIIDGVQSQLLGIGIWVSVGLVMLRARGLNHQPFGVVIGLSSFVAVGLLGARLGAVLVGQLDLSEFLNPALSGMTSSGGVVAASLLALLFMSNGQAGRTLLDDITPGMWFLLAISRVGCVFQGCDFGQASSWGFVYRMPSAAWNSQLLSGQIPAAATQSLATFPFAALDAGAALVALAVAWKPSKRGYSTLLSGLVYLVIRCGLEFGRDPTTTEMWGVFTRPQAVLIIVAFGCYMGMRIITGTADDSISS